jgi:Fur family ferric uptake transcriptional regulator
VLLHRWHLDEVRTPKPTKKDQEREQTAALIRSAGLRVTSPRTAVLALLRDARTPLSHAEVATRLEHQAFDRATVYRNLVDLTEAGILQRTEVGHTFRFELVDEQPGHRREQHPHFVCTGCGKVACLPASSVSFKAPRTGPSALRRGKLEIQLRGLCDACH